MSSSSKFLGRAMTATHDEVILCEDTQRAVLPLRRVTKRIADKAKANTRRRWGKRAELVRDSDGIVRPLVLICGDSQEKRDYVADRLIELARLANKPTPIRDWLKRVKTELYWAFVRMRSRWSSWRRKNNA